MAEMNRRHAWSSRRATAGARAYVFATLVSAAALVVAFLAHRYLSTANLSLILLTAVLAVAVRTRMLVAVYTAIICFLGDNFLFTPPRYTLAISHADDLVTVALFLAVALVCSRMATRLSSQVAALHASQARTRALLQLGQRLTTAKNSDAICASAAMALAQALGAQAAVLIRDADGLLRIAATEPQGLVLGARDIAAANCSNELESIDVQAPDVQVSDSFLMLPLAVGDRRHGTVAVRLPDADTNRVELAMAMTHDIGLALERARLAGELEQTRVQAETEGLRNALLSSVSHDLRSPLASMIGAASTLANYEAQLPHEERRQLMEAILEEGQRLDRYIQNLLDMTRLGHGTLKLHRDWVDVTELVVAATNRLRKLFPDQKLETSLPPDTVLLYVHPALIEQALFNILENAAHFSPPGESVRIEVMTLPGQLQIDVIDRGPGIPLHERPLVFDTFYSVSRGDRGTKGTGLGLSICRGMIGAHGGRVEALGGIPTGTIMRVTLPLPPTPESSA